MPDVELYASGFNAWGQLRFENIPSSSDSAEEDTDDLQTFTPVLRLNTVGDVRVRAFFSFTIVTCDDTGRMAGYLPSAHTKWKEQDPRAHDTLAEASNGIVAYINSTGAVRQFASLHHALTRTSVQKYDHLPPCQQLVAYETGFMALTSGRHVYTWGDERYAACLGREPSETSPAHEPGLVDALQHLPTGPIIKVAAGGYVLAALTAGHDLYIWGGHPGRKTLPLDLSDEPTPLDIGDQDIADVAVGESHILVLTVSGRLLVLGTNSNGQLGSSEGSEESWTNVDLGLPVGAKVVQVATGPRNSFIVVER